MIIYSRPPYPPIAYPYLLLSVTDRSSEKHVKPGVRCAIIDSGVFRVFHELSRTEYPGGYRHWIHRVASFWYYVSRYIPDAYAVIPDYPADYRHNPLPQNMERTLRNIEHALDRFPDVRWLVPVQGLPDSVSSVVRFINTLKGRGLLRGDYVAVAPTCVTRSAEHLRRLAVVARAHLPGYRIHMFGVIRSAWDKVRDHVYSVDSIIYSFYCYELFKRKCQTTSEHVAGWVLFLRELRDRGYLGAEDFELSIESAKRLGLSTGEIHKLLRYATAYDGQSPG